MYPRRKTLFEVTNQHDIACDCAAREGDLYAITREVEKGNAIKDIEAAAAFLCSAASYINGAILVVDGGHWLAANRLV